MNDERYFLWDLVKQRLLDCPSWSSEPILGRILSGELNYPALLERDVCRYAQEGGVETFNRLSLEVVKSFYLSGFEPEGHILIIAYLRSVAVVSAREACRLVQVDGSNFPLMRERMRYLVRLAEILTEEEVAGIRSIEDDQTLSELLEYIYADWKFSEKRASAAQ